VCQRWDTRAGFALAGAATAAAAVAVALAARRSLSAPPARRAVAVQPVVEVAG
jgi:hypothetical protein